jgi:hypothetical protein
MCQDVTSSSSCENYAREGSRITMFRRRRVMSPACVSTRWSETPGVNCFTRTIVDPGKRVAECTDEKIGVQ